MNSDCQGRLPRSSRGPEDAAYETIQPQAEANVDNVGRYRDLWDSLASTIDSARYFCDGSSSEADLNERGVALVQRIAEAIDVQGQHTVLEIGCGVARLGLPMAKRCAAWHGCDVSPRMLALAANRTSRCSNVTLTLLDHTSLSIYDDGTFDRAYTIGLFCHLHKEDVFRYLCEVRRVLKPGGVFCCGMWNLCAEHGWRLWMDYIQKDDGVIIHTWTTPEEFRQFINGSGLTLQELLTDSEYLVEAVVSKGPTRALLRPQALVDDDGLFVDRSDERRR
jgi:SAM-dependent methyltransferase